MKKVFISKVTKEYLNLPLVKPSFSPIKAKSSYFSVPVRSFWTDKLSLDLDNQLNK